MARKTKYSPEVVARIVQAVELGSTFELAAQYGGIDGSTFYRWMAQRSEFRDAVKGAEALGAMKWLAKIEQAASEGTWQAAAWKLERRYPQSYGRTVQDLNHGGQSESPVSLVLVKRGEPGK